MECTNLRNIIKEIVIKKYIYIYRISNNKIYILKQKRNLYHFNK